MGEFGLTPFWDSLAFRYLLLVGVVDRLRECMRVVHGPIPETSHLHQFLIASAGVLEGVTGLCSDAYVFPLPLISPSLYVYTSSPQHHMKNNRSNNHPIWTPRPPSETKTLLCDAFKGDLVGLVTMLDSILFCRGATGGDVGVEEVDERVVELTVGVLKVLGNVCGVELGLVQVGNDVCYFLLVLCLRRRFLFLIFLPLHLSSFLFLCWQYTGDPHGRRHAIRILPSLHFLGQILVCEESDVAFLSRHI